MKKFLIPALLFGALGALSPQVFADGCDITVSFGSYASGIDHKTKSKITSYVEKSKNITNHRLIPWGREGEKSLCLTVAPKAFDKVYKDLKAMIPKESKKAWTAIRAKGKPTYRTQWPK